MSKEEIDPSYHDCVYDDPELRYKSCGMCIYRFTCKYIRYDIKPKEDVNHQAVLLSIHPEHIRKMIFGEKEYEFRRQIWKKEIKKVYIYATKPVGKIVGYFTYKRIIKGHPDHLWLHCKEKSGLTEQEFFDYFNGKQLGYAISIDKLEMFHNGLELEKVLPGVTAPQNFMYIQNNIEEVKNKMNKSERLKKEHILKCPDCNIELSPFFFNFDFPIGAILHIRKMFDEPTPRRMVIKSTKIVREGFHSELVIEEGKFDISHNSFFNYNLYYGFKWNHHFRQIELIPREILSGLEELVLRKKKLPTRKVIMLEDTTTYGCLSWGELRRYYWSECGYPQHFKEEKWMDNSVVIITSGYLNKDGLQFDENTQKRIEHIKKYELGVEI